MIFLVRHRRLTPQSRGPIRSQMTALYDHTSTLACAFANLNVPFIHASRYPTDCPRCECSDFIGLDRDVASHAHEFPTHYSLLAVSAGGDAP